MHLNLSDEQQLMAETADRFFREGPALAEARRLESEGGAKVSMPIWAEAHAMGFVTMRVPEAAGGAGAGLLEAALVCEAAGRQITPIPLPDAMAAARLLADLNDPRATELLDGLESRPIGLDGSTAADQLVLDGDALLLRGADGKTQEIARSNSIADAYQAAEAERALLNAAWLAGAADGAIALGAAYSGERKAFGKLIGSFQGVAFPLADAATDIEAGRLLVWRAIWAISEGREDAGALVAMADWWLSDSARRAVIPALRTFGGYGLSIEYDIHLYFQAIHREALAKGDPADRLAHVGERLWAGETVALPDAGDPGIEPVMGDKAEAYAKEVRAFFAANLTEDAKIRGHLKNDGHDPEFHKKLCAAGHAYPDWPKEWGGQERSAMEMTALNRVFAEYRWNRIQIGTTNMGARMTMKFGSPELQAEVLPRLADGTSFSCLGFTEPESGSDMYAARTRAERADDGSGDWIINGSKMFTTGAQISDYVLMLARTDPDASKHRGITIFYFPMSLPGVSFQRVDTLMDERTNITFYDNVRVPDRYRVGEINGGLQVMAAAMDLEHGGEGYHMHHRSMMEAVMAWANAADAKGKKPIEDPAVRTRLAKVATHIELSDLLCLRATWAGEIGTLTRAHGPMAKLFSTEIYVDDAADMAALTAPFCLRHTTPALGEIEELQRQSIGQTIYGGTSEVHRSIIAQHGLGMPRSS